MSQNSAYVLIIFLAFGGFLIARFLRHHIRNVEEPLICPLKGNCDTVIHSDYSKIFGIPLEELGMIYYGVIAVCFGLIIVFPSLDQPTINSALLFIITCAFVFSLYLTMLQAFIIKNWCTWCLSSFIICTAIFILGASVSPLYSELFSNILLSV